MSELKAYIGPAPDEKGLADYYLKSEADKVIAELKSKIEAGDRQIENLINSATDIMLRQDRVNDAKCDELRRQKYKRCMAMAKWCEAEVHKSLTEQSAIIDFPEIDRFQYLQWHFVHFSRWHRRWLELAKRFK